MQRAALPAPRRRRARIRAVRHHDPQRAVAQRVAALLLLHGSQGGMFAGDAARHIGRALRAERRAARGRASGYDLLRHLALLRVQQALARRGRSGSRQCRTLEARAT